MDTPETSFSNADIPLIQISINSHLPIKDQVNIENALKDLGEEDILDFRLD